MKATRAETIPDTWDPTRDVPFFRITARMFSSSFCRSASLLLAQNDENRENTSAATPNAPEEPRTTAEPHVVPVPVRISRYA